VIRDISALASSTSEQTDAARRLSPAAAAEPKLVGPFGEGASVVLECETSGGWPEPALSWWRDGRLVDDSYEIVSALDGQLLERRRASSAGLAGSSSALPDGQPADAAAGELEGPPLEQQPGSAVTGSSDLEGLETTLGPGGHLRGETAAPKVPPGARLMRNRLQLGPLQRADLLANYSCKAANNKLGQNPSSFVMIDMNRK